MTPDLLLINPPVSLEERYGAFASVGSQAAPLGLCYLAAMARSRGYTVRIIDAPALNWNRPRTIREIVSSGCPLVGITATTCSIIRAAELARAIKAGGVYARIILGGPHVSALPAATLREFPDFDIGVINEGEDTIVDILDRDRGMGDLRDVPGIIFRRGEELVLTEARPLIQDLDRLPMPAWDLIPDLATYYKPAPHSYYQLPSSTLMTSRGCNGTCTFCARPFMGEVYRSNSPEYTLDMIDHLVRHYGIRDIMFYDDNFLLDRKRVTTISEEILRRGYNISWSCLARTDVTPKDFYQLIRRAGCWQIAYGIESGNQQILDNLKKRVKVERVVDMIRQANDVGIVTRGYFMIGCPGETRDTIEETIQFMNESGLKEFHVTFCTPMPGAELFDTAAQYGQFDCDWKKLGFWDPVFIPHGMTKDELIAGHRRMFRKFYLRPGVIARYLLRIVNRPSILINMIRAALDVVRYSMAGYIRDKFGRSTSHRPA